MNQVRKSKPRGAKKQSSSNEINPVGNDNSKALDNNNYLDDFSGFSILTNYMEANNHESDSSKL